MSVNSKIVHLPLNSSPHRVDAQHSPFDLRNSEGDRFGKLSDSSGIRLFFALIAAAGSFEGQRLLATFPLA
jgi:hypothetical protein